MAFAAGIGQLDPIYLDTTRADGVAVHPVFPVAPEWALLTNPDTAFDLGVEPDEVARGVHAGHAVTLHQPLRQNVEVALRAQVAGIEATRAGARVTIRFDAHDPLDQPVWTTWMQSLYLGVQVDGAGVAPTDALLKPAGRAAASEAWPIERRIDLDAGAAHVYSECARIWNPIHTDRVMALRAGLSDIVLHGSATLARGVSVALEALGIGPTDVASFGGTFRTPVCVPSSIRVVVRVADSDSHRTARFEVHTGTDEVAVSSAYVTSVDLV
jgi:hypothetical protein